MTLYARLCSKLPVGVVDGFYAVAYAVLIVVLYQLLGNDTAPLYYLHR